MRVEPTSHWTLVRQSLARPYRVTIPMVALVALVPLYIFIPHLPFPRTPHAPAIALDRVIPLQPVWALIYGALYLFLILLPIFVVRQEEHIRRTVYAYLTIWLTAYVFFVFYPTIAPRPEEVMGEGFAIVGLRFLYDSDPPYNCFPSLHVAHSFVSALTCYRLHRGVGMAAMISATLVAISTLFTKQHYVLDVIAGVLLAYAAYAIFVGRYRNDDAADRKVAPIIAIGLASILGALVALLWTIYSL